MLLLLLLLIDWLILLFILSNISLDKLHKSTAFTTNVCGNTEMLASGDIAFNASIASA